MFDSHEKRSLFDKNLYRSHDRKHHVCYDEEKGTDSGRKKGHSLEQQDHRNMVCPHSKNLIFETYKLLKQVFLHTLGNLVALLDVLNSRYDWFKA